MQNIDLNKATQPYEYYMKHIKENRRPDGRKLSEIRPCSVKPECIQNTANGSSIVKLGSTTVVCGVQARLFTPKPERQDRGYLVPNVELPALCSSKNFSSSSSSSSQSGGGGSSGGGGAGGKSSGNAMGSQQSIEQTQSMLSQLMLDILTESKCIDDRTLCIAPGRLAWSLYIDLVCLNHDGNVQDACTLAMVSALRTVRLPEIAFVDVQEDGSGGEAKLTYPLKFTRLQLTCEPVCTTLFAIEAPADGVILLSDPNKLEEEFARTFLVVCTIDATRMCLIRKLGAGLGFNQQQLDLCVGRALENGTHIRRNVLANA